MIFLNNSQIKNISKKILSTNGTGSRTLMMLMLLNLLIFSALPFTVSFFANKYMGNMAEVISAAAIVILLLINLFTYSSFALGSCAWFNFYGKKNRGVKAAYWFKPSKSALSARLYFVLFFRKLMWCFALLFPGTAVLISSVLLAMDGGIELNLFICSVAGGAATLIFGAAFLFVILQKYFLAPYIMAANPTLTIREIIKLSRLASDGILKKTAAFKLSFLPWLLSCAAVFPAFYVWPYYRQCCAVYAKQIQIPQGV